MSYTQFTATCALDRSSLRFSSLNIMFILFFIDASHQWNRKGESPRWQVREQEWNPHIQPRPGLHPPLGDKEEETKGGVGRRGAGAGSHETSQSGNCRGRRWRRDGEEKEEKEESSQRRSPLSRRWVFILIKGKVQINGWLSQDLTWYTKQLSWEMILSEMFLSSKRKPELFCRNYKKLSVGNFS